VSAPGVHRPRVICHMMASIDGRIVTAGWPISDEQQAHYESIHDAFGANAWMCGRVTMAMHFARGMRTEDEVANEHTGGPRADFVAPGEHASYAIALDAHGRLIWESGVIDGDHVVAILSERVHDDYLAQLRSLGITTRRSAALQNIQASSRSGRARMTNEDPPLPLFISGSILRLLDPVSTRTSGGLGDTSTSGGTGWCRRERRRCPQESTSDVRLCQTGSWSYAAGPGHVLAAVSPWSGLEAPSGQVVEWQRGRPQPLGV